MMPTPCLPRTLAVLVCLLFVLPAWGQQTPSSEPTSTSPSDAESFSVSAIENQAKELIDAGQFVEALRALEPLLAQRPLPPNALFLAGLASLNAASNPALDQESRDTLLDAAIRAFQSMLVQDPGLIRVRLELARAFFLKGEDSLARGHFEAVLAGDPPAPVVANVNRFLAQIRARRRWSTYLGFALAPDSNIGSQSTTRTINILGLPFQRDGDEFTTSGVGVSIWGGAEYEYPYSQRTRFRSGFDLSRREYSQSQFDQMTLSTHVGPRWLISPRSEMSLLATARWRESANEPYSDEYGIRVEARRRFTRQTTGRLRAYVAERFHDRGSNLDGPVMDMSIGMSHVLLPTLRADWTLGWGRERPEQEYRRNTSRYISAGLTSALPRGFTLGGNVTQRWTDYKGAWPTFNLPGELREDKTRSYRLNVNHRGFTWRGFSPRVSVVHEERESTAQLHDYKRTFGELSFVRLF